MQSSFTAVSTEQLIDYIAHAGSTVSQALIDGIQSRKREITPHLHVLLAKPLLPSAHELDEYARCHALIFLSSWQDERTLSIISDILRRPDDNLYMLYEYLEHTIPAFGSHAIDVLASVLHDVHAPQSSRIVASTTLGSIANIHPLTTRSVTKILRDILPHPAHATPNDHELWSWVVVTLAELRSKAAQPQINQLYQAGFLDPAICGRPDELARAVNESIVRTVFQDPLLLYQ
ncbi:MAG: DUF1186 domain-containing protein [Roseiflexaceae bacterium]